MRIEAVERISLTTRDAAGLAAFYGDAFGFRDIGRHAIDAAIYGAGGSALTLRLGSQEIELVQFDRPGALYPPVRSSHDRFFQHIALVTTDIRRALARLPAQATMISRDAPVTLPASSGGVTAAKFRDPDGHPLELLQFPADAIPEHWRGATDMSQPCIGIDHSALVVTDTIRSIEFYSSIGLTVMTRTVNIGIAQDRLDYVEAARVDVIGLAPRRTTPHVELLDYRSPRPGSSAVVADADIAATRLILRHPGGQAPVRMMDPDGHRLVLLPG
ncbi:VOC family protein [Lichenicoccus sp.]|uniref:VOC family protein n=1 Tax=Lichenicoccus sp. TaxID=2781899 RepID=UPI003D0CD999